MQGMSRGLINFVISHIGPGSAFNTTLYGLGIPPRMAGVFSGWANQSGPQRYTVVVNWQARLKK